MCKKLKNSQKNKSPLFEKVLKCEKYDEAGELCLGGLPAEQPGGYYHNISPWLYRLYSMYDTINNKTKMAETTEKMLLNGDLKYYDKLKPLPVEQKLWEKHIANYSTSENLTCGIPNMLKS